MNSASGRESSVSPKSSPNYYNTKPKRPTTTPDSTHQISKKYSNRLEYFDGFIGGFVLLTNVSSGLLDRLTCALPQRVFGLPAEGGTNRGYPRKARLTIATPNPSDPPPHPIPPTKLVKNTPIDWSILMGLLVALFY